MRIIAAIYLTIMLVNVGIWLASGHAGNAFPTPYSFVMWSLYFLSVLSLLAFVLRVRMLPRTVWRSVFVVYLAYRLVELLTAGLVLNGDNPVLGLNTVSNYLWLVVPPGLAMWYLGFMPLASRERQAHEPNLRPIGQPDAR